MPRSLEINYLGEIRILQVLSRKGSLNMTALQKEVGMSYKYAKKHLEKLMKDGLVKIRSYGNVKMVSLNEDDTRTRLIEKLFGNFESGD